MAWNFLISLRPARQPLPGKLLRSSLRVCSYRENLSGHTWLEAHREPQQCTIASEMSEPSPRKLIIAIDGPAGAGKSTIASRLARKLGYVNLESGAMYRLQALKAIE